MSASPITSKACSTAGCQGATGSSALFLARQAVASGTVEGISLRTTRLRDVDGNGFINTTDLVHVRDRQGAVVPGGTPGGSLFAGDPGPGREPGQFG